jgi:hypothetical protein
VVAKIYYTLYYAFYLDDPSDVTGEVDHDYSLGTAAYKHLKEQGQRNGSVPKYLGS